jgi:hypothetical protein
MAKNALKPGIREVKENTNMSIVSAAPATAEGGEKKPEKVEKVEKVEKRPLKGLEPREVALLIKTAQDARIPLAVREQLLAAYDIPKGVFSPDPRWGEKIADGAIKAVGGLVIAAGAAVSLVLLVEASKAFLRSVGALPPLPAENPST